MVKARASLYVRVRACLWVRYYSHTVSDHPRKYPYLGKFSEHLMRDLRSFCRKGMGRGVGLRGDAEGYWR